MKILGISSSPHYSGNTATLVREVLKGAQEQGAAVEEIHLPKYNLNYCIGCRRCHATGSCVHDDGFNEIMDKMREADGIVLGSPVYLYEYNGYMKNFFDRAGFYALYCSLFAEKYFIGVSTSGGAGHNKIAKRLVGLGPNGFLNGIANGNFKRSYITGVIGKALWKKGRIEKYSRTMKKAYRLGKKMVKDIEKKRTYPFQNIIGRMLIFLFARRLKINWIVPRKEKETKALYEDLKKKGFL
jgi:multimeric flavodoxin WrbA